LKIILNVIIARKLFNMENYKLFEKTQKEFVSKLGGRSYNKTWFDLVQENHSELRKRIGGVSLTKTVKIQSKQGKANKKNSDNIINQISEIVPNLDYCLKDFGLDRGALLLPYISIHSHNQNRTGKFLLDVLTNHIYSTYDRQTARYIYPEETRSRTGSYEENKAKLNILISKLGSEWAKAKSKTAEFEITLSTAAMDFLNLGHYEVDIDSCFGQNGDREEDKALLGQNKNTFVIIIKNKEQIIARTWGFVDSKFTIYNTCNLYLGKYVQQGDIIEALKVFFAGLLDKDANDIFLHENFVDIDDSVYRNDYGIYSFSAEEKIKYQLLEIDEYDIKRGYTCEGCGTVYDYDGEFDRIDGELRCLGCVDKANYCDHSCSYTYEDLIQVKEQYGSIHVKQEFAKFYKKCYECEMRVSDSYYDFDESKCLACCENKVNS
jgi:hypothetical protein